jgi:hypothetical protein
MKMVVRRIKPTTNFFCHFSVVGEVGAATTSHSSGLHCPAAPCGAIERLSEFSPLSSSAAPPPSPQIERPGAEDSAAEAPSWNNPPGGYARRAPSSNGATAQRRESRGNGSEKQVQRIEHAATCAVCGKSLKPNRTGRPRCYCSDRCRDEARRGRDYASFVGCRYPNEEIPQNADNNAARSMTCEGHFGDQAHGIIGPAGVIAVEVTARRRWCAETSIDGVIVEVAR